MQTTNLTEDNLNPKGFKYQYRNWLLSVELSQRVPLCSTESPLAYTVSTKVQSTTTIPSEISQWRHEGGVIISNRFSVQVKAFMEAIPFMSECGSNL